MPFEQDTRDPVTGQFSFGDNLNRKCKCGHTLGIHTQGGFECLNQDTGDGTQCDCAKFRPISRDRAAQSK